MTALVLLNNLRLLIDSRRKLLLRQLLGLSSLGDRLGQGAVDGGVLEFFRGFLELPHVRRLAGVVAGLALRGDLARASHCRDLVGRALADIGLLRRLFNDNYHRAIVRKT